jgi:large repetitive protein
VTMSSLSGSSNFVVNSTQILNGNAVMDAICGSGGVCGSVEVNGTNITTLTFKLYIHPDGSVGTWPSTPGFTSDFFLMGVSLSNASVSGNVFNDKNALTNNSVDGAGTNCSGINALLVDGDGKVYATTPVAADGTYSFGSVVVAATYTVILSSTPGVVGSTAPAPSLPAKWINTGEYIGTGVGSDGTPNGSVVLNIASGTINNVNFGISEDQDGDGIIDSIDIDDDNDGILDSDEGGQICASSVTVSLNTVPYAFNTLLNTSTTQSPVNINNLLFGSLNYVGSLVGVASWNAGSGVAPNNIGGVQIKNNSVPTVGHYVYMQPVNTNTSTLTGANTTNYAKYELNFPTPVTDFSFVSGGLNNGDTYEIYAFNGATAVPLDAADLSGFSPALGVDWTVYDLGAGMKVVGNSTLGGTNVDTNIFTTSIGSPITRIEIRSYKNFIAAPSPTSTVTTAVTSFQYCTVAPFLDTDNDNIPNYLDLDSDADGCSDALEAGATTNTTANYAFTGTFGVNGLIDTKETTADNGVINYTLTYANATNSAFRACNTLPAAVNDAINIQQGAAATPVLVLANDNFGADGPSTSAITITQPAANGTASVDNNGTPTNPLDDKIIYTPNATFAGLDSVKYQICDVNGDCSIATIRITVLQNPTGLCAAQLGIPVINLDFGTGAVSDMPSVYPTAVTNYIYSSAPGFGDGSYAIINNGTAVGGGGFNVAEHTIGSATGRMAGFNASFAPGEFLRIPVNGLAPNTKYQYSAWFANVYPPGIKPNVTFEIYDATNNALVITKSTGDFAANANWFQDGFTFVTGTSANYILVLKNNAPGGGGNDLVIDDIQFAHCGPTTTVNVTGGTLAGNTVSGCNDAITLTGNVQTGSYTTPQYQWQISTDNGVTFVDSVGATNISLNLVISTFTNNKQYRLKVAETGNINNATAVIYSNTIIVSKTNCLPIANPDRITIAEDAPATTINVITNDNFGGDGPSSSAITITKNAKNGLFSVNNNGTPTNPTDDKIVYTPNLNFNGKDTLNYEICDASGDCDTALVVITVTAVNDAPIATRDNVSTNFNTVLIIHVLGNDTDVEGLDSTGVIIPSIPVLSAPKHGTVTSINLDNGDIEYTPNTGFSGKDTLIYRVCDNDAFAPLCDTALVVITVGPAPNNTPIANRDDVATTQNTLIPIGVLGNDSDSDGSLVADSVRVTRTPVNGTFTVRNSTDGAILYTPNAGFIGKDTLIYRVCDNGTPVLCDTALVVITVNPTPNVPPLANRDNFTFPEDTTGVILTVLTNDTDSDGTLVSNTVTVTKIPSNGTATPNINGTITYAPFANFNGKDTLIYRVCDNGGLCDTALVVFNVTAVNDAPIANRDNFTVPEDTTGVILTVLTNDTDIDGTLVSNTVTVTKTPTNGTATPNADGTITYNPNPNFNGKDTLIYRVCDNGGLCDTALVVFTVSSVNDAPIATRDNFTVPEDTTGVILTVLTNDTDIDGTLVSNTVTVTKTPTNGTATPNADGTITYNPNPNFNGKDTLIYRVCDNGGLCDTALVVFIVTSVNDAPLANRDDVTTPFFTLIAIPVLSNDTDIDGIVVKDSVKITMIPAHGTANINATTGAINYNPTAGFSGKDTLIYRVCDNGTPVQCDTALVVITVNAPAANITPSVNRDDVSTAANTLIVISVLSNDLDSDGSIVPDSVKITSNPTKGSVSVNTNGTINYTPVLGFAGKDTLIYRACDNGTPVLCDTALVVITVNPAVNNAPLANRDDVSTPLNTYILITVLTNDTDLGGALVPDSVKITSNPKNGLASVNGNGTLNYTPTFGYSGKDTLIYRVCDNGVPALCDTALVVITVNAAANVKPNANRDNITVAEDTTGVILTVLNNDTDSDGTLVASSVTVTKTPTNGTATPNPDGTITYNPKPNFNGIDSLIYQVCDNGGLCDTALVVFTVTSVNDAPLANRDNYVLVKNSVGNVLSVLTNDTDIDGTLNPASVVMFQSAHHGSSLVSFSGNGLITYTPSANYVGLDTLIYQVCDNGGLCDTALVVITINAAANVAPIANRDNFTLPEDTTAMTLTVLINDTDSDGTLNPNSVTLTKNPSHGTATPNSNGTITYTPTLNFNGSDTLIYQVCDNGALCATALVVFTVSPVNDAPLANRDNFTIPEDTTGVKITVLTNDTDIDGALVASSVTVTKIPTNGTATPNPDGTITYTPNPNFNGKDTLIYQVCDNGTPLPAACDTALVVFTVTAVNDAPLANRDNFTINEDVVSATVNVLSNDTDVENGINPASVTVTRGPAHGTATPNPDGTITYIPALNFNGQDTLIYQVCDSGSPILCDTALVIFTVTPVNDKPVAGDDAKTTAEDTPLSSTVATNDTDVDNNIDPASFVKLGGPKNGGIVFNNNGGFVYTPALNFNGKDTVSYKMCDLGTPVLCDTAILVITVTPVNDKPIAARDTIIGNEDMVITGTVSGNDTDADGNLDPNSFFKLTEPTKGTILFFNNGSFTYTPNVNFNGTDSIRYKVCDFGGLCDTTMLIFIVNSVNDAPVASNDGYGTPLNTPVSGNVSLNDTDVDNNINLAGFAQTVGPSKGTIVFNNDGTFTYTPNTGYIGRDSVSYKVCDTGTPSLCDTAKIYISTPINPNDSPIAVNDTIATPEDVVLNGTVASNDVDNSGSFDPNGFVKLDNPTHGLIVFNTNGTYTYTPTLNFNGGDSIHYKVCNTLGFCDTATLIITVTPVNDKPLAVDDLKNTPEDGPLSSTVATNDTDVDNNIDPVSFVKLKDPKNGGIVFNNNGVFIYTPTLNFNGKDTIEYKVCDLGTPSLCDTAFLIITVTPVNDAPFAVNDTFNVVGNTTLNGTVATNDSDIDGNLGTGGFVKTDNPIHGTITVNPNGSFVYNPTTSFSGIDSVHYKVCDLAGLCDTATIIITVTPANVPPLANIDTPVLNEDTPTIINVLKNDADTDGFLNPASLTIIKQPSHGIVTPNADSTITYIPNLNFNGKDTLIYQVCDKGSPVLCDTAIVILIINAVNDAPLANRDDISTTANTLVAIAVLANDTDVDGTVVKDSVKVTLSPVHGTASVNITTGLVTYTPMTGFSGKDTLIYRVCDNGTPVQCDTALVVITVNPAPNVAPIATRDDISTPQNTAVLITVLGNDNDSDGILVKDSVKVTLSPSHGTASVNTTTGVITYTPMSGYSGKDTLIYRVCDNGIPVQCDTALVIITVVAPVVNLAPVAIRDDISTPQNTAVSIIVLGNDNDSDGILVKDSVKVTLSPSHGAASVNTTTGVITYTPITGYSGKDTLIYRVCDNGIPVQCDTALVVITVVAPVVNQSPVANKDNVSTSPNTIVSIPVLINDTDADGNLNPASVRVQQSPAHGIALPNSDGTISYSPDAGFIGNDTLIYRVCDTGTPPLCATATVVITVNVPVNKAPVANRDDISTPLNTLVTLNVLSNDSDDGILVADSVKITTKPKNGVAFVNMDGTITYTPNAGYTGKDTLVYNVCDDGAPVLCDTALVVITVIAPTPNQAPVANRDDVSTSPNTIVSIPVLTNDTDTEGALNPSSVKLQQSPANGVALPNSDGTISYSPNAGFIGKDTLIYRVCDSGTPPLCDTAIVVITVSVPVNKAPLANRDDVSTPLNTLKTINVLSNDSDDGILVADSVKITLQPTNGTATVNANGTIIYTPNTGYLGQDTLIYNVCDNGIPALCDTALVVIKVTPPPANQAPVANRDDVSTTPTTLVSIPVLSNDTDSDGILVPDSVKITLSPAHGATLVNVNGTISYVPEIGFVGKDTLIYRVCDNGTPSLCDTALVVITVDSTYCADILADKTILAKCSTDSIVCINISTTEIAKYTLTLDGALYTKALSNCGALANGTGLKIGQGKHQVIFSKINSACKDTVEITVACPKKDTIARSAFVGTSDTVCLDTKELTGTTFTVTPICAGKDSIETFALIPNTTCVAILGKKFGKDTLCFSVCDEKGVCDTTYIRVQVTAADIRATDDSITAVINTPISINVTANDTAGGAGKTSVAIIKNPNNGLALVRPDGTIIYTPNPDYCSSKPDSMTYSICSGTKCDTAVVRVRIPCDAIKVYTGFSPNGDGRNDFFVIEGLDKYPEHQLTIYNRWGNQVFDAKNYKNNWAGTFNNQHLPDGTYYYILDKGDGTTKLYGWLQIQR